MVGRRYFRFALSLFVLASGGCRQGKLFIGAVACQGWSRPANGERSDPWQFQGLDARATPRIRPGSYASATYTVPFLDPDNLGTHGYWLDWSEKNGIVYTCRGGHIDIAHVRKAADWTGYLAARTLEAIAHGQTAFRFKLHEPSRYYVELAYPANWTQRPKAERVRVAREVSVALGQHLAYTAMTWHEILTWFGFRQEAYKSEFPSAFSWEDTYSNLLGTHVAAGVLVGNEGPFSEAVTLALREAIERLEAQPAVMAQQTTESLRNRWFLRKGLTTVIMKRNLDLGLGDGYVTPSLIPDVPRCSDSTPQALAVPKLDILHRQGFEMKLTIAPRVWETGRILRVIDSDAPGPTRRIEPAVHFPRIMDHIAVDAAGRYGYEVDPDRPPVTRTSIASE